MMLLTTPVFTAAPSGSIPTMQGIGTPQLSAAAATLPMPSHVADDILLAIALTRSDQAVLTDPVGTGWTAVAGSPIFAGTAGRRISLYWKRATGTDSEAALAIGDSGNINGGMVLCIRGCPPSVSPVALLASATITSAAGTETIPGGTTSGANRLIVQIMTTPRDALTSDISGVANADLASLTVAQDWNSDTSNGAAALIVTGEKAVAGAFGATSFTRTTAALAVHSATLEFLPT